MPLPAFLAIAGLQAAQSLASELIPSLSRDRSRYRSTLHPSISPEQRGLLEQLLPLISPSGTLARQAGGDPEALGGLDQSVVDDFSKQILPTLLQQYSNVGLGKSSALQNALGQATRSSLTDLARERFSRSQQAQGGLLNFYRTILGHPYQQYSLEAKPFVGSSPIGGSLANLALLGGGALGGGLGGFGGGR